MNRTTAAEPTGVPPASGQRSAAHGSAAHSPAARWSVGQRSAARIAAVVVTVSLLSAGSSAPQGTDAPLPSAERTATEGSAAQPAGADGQRPGAGQSQPGPPPAAAARVPGSAVPVRPAAPPAPGPKDPAPRALTVEGTTINMAVVQVGVSPDGAMEIPEPFNEAGWYRFGPAPGAAAGTAVVAAHVDTTSDSAPFSQLKSLRPGTLVTVRRDGAPPVTFRVTGVELMAKDAFDGASIFRRDGPPQLKLVTCGGRWLDEQQDYGDNVIVTAVPA
jgi:Sortase domain